MPSLFPVVDVVSFLRFDSGSPFFKIVISPSSNFIEPLFSLSSPWKKIVLFEIYSEPNGLPSEPRLYVKPVVGTISPSTVVVPPMKTLLLSDTSALASILLVFKLSLICTKLLPETMLIA